MNISIRLQGKDADVFGREASAYNVSATAYVKAILHTVAKENLGGVMVADLELDEFEGRKRGRPKIVKAAEKARSSRKVTKVEINGVTMTIRELSEATGISPATLLNKARHGADMAEYVASYKRPTQYLFQGEMMTAERIARILGRDPTSLRRRLAKGFTIEEIIRGRRV